MTKVITTRYSKLEITLSEVLTNFLISIVNMQIFAKNHLNPLLKDTSQEDNNNSSPEIQTNFSSKRSSLKKLINYKHIDWQFHLPNTIFWLKDLRNSDADKYNEFLNLFKDQENLKHYNNPKTVLSDTILTNNENFKLNKGQDSPNINSYTGNGHYTVNHTRTNSIANSITDSPLPTPTHHRIPKQVHINLANTTNNSKGSTNSKTISHFRIKIDILLQSTDENFQCNLQNVSISNDLTLQQKIYSNGYPPHQNFKFIPPENYILNNSNYELSFSTGLNTFHLTKLDFDKALILYWDVILHHKVHNLVKKQVGKFKISKGNIESRISGFLRSPIGTTQKNWTTTSSYSENLHDNFGLSTNFAAYQNQKQGTSNTSTSTNTYLITSDQEDRSSNRTRNSEPKFKDKYHAIIKISELQIKIHLWDCYKNRKDGETSKIVLKNLTVKLSYVQFRQNHHQLQPNNSQLIFSPKISSTEKSSKSSKTSYIIEIDQLQYFCHTSKIATLSKVKFYPVPAKNYRDIKQVINFRKRWIRKYLSLESNLTLILKVQDLTLSFPDYTYNFSDHIENLVNTIKSTKSLYVKKEPSAFDPDSKLLCWPDVQIIVDQLEIWIGDDPFETRLRDNLLLMRDEKLERDRREKLCKEKLKEEKYYARAFQKLKETVHTRMNCLNVREFVRRATALNSKFRDPNYRKSRSKSGNSYGNYSSNQFETSSMHSASSEYSYVGSNTVYASSIKNYESYSSNTRNRSFVLGRHSQLNQKTPSDHNIQKLVSIKGSNLNFVAMADPNFHSVDKALKHLIEIDKDSPKPNPKSEWLTLWFRITNFQGDSLSFQLRDYELPIASLKKFCLSGRTGMAEIKGNQRHCRTAEITISDENPQELLERLRQELMLGPDNNNLQIDDFVLSQVSRNMIQLKTYYDIDLNLEELTVSWTTTYDPAMTQFTTALDLILPVTEDPSPILPWWDKIRMLLHGNLAINAKHAEYHSLANMIDPHDISERLIFEFDELLLIWSNAKFHLMGDTSVQLKTIQREESKIAYFPRLDLTLQVDYVLNDNRYNKNDHHAIMPISKQLDTTLFNNFSLENWDTFRRFRSRKLDLDLELIIKGNHQNQKARIELYESSIDLVRLWIASQAFPTRPTKRTVQFNLNDNRRFLEIEKPPGIKPKLGRSYGRSKLKFLSELTEIYYKPHHGAEFGIFLDGEKTEYVITAIQTKATGQNGNSRSRVQKMFWDIQNYRVNFSKTELSILSFPSSTTVKNKNTFFINWTNAKIYYKKQVKEKVNRPYTKYQIDDFKLLWTKEIRFAIYYLYQTSTRILFLNENLAFVPKEWTTKKWHEKKMEKSAREERRKELAKLGRMRKDQMLQKQQKKEELARLEERGNNEEDHLQRTLNYLQSQSNKIISVESSSEDEKVTENFTNSHPPPVEKQFRQLQKIREPQTLHAVTNTNFETVQSRTPVVEIALGNSQIALLDPDSENYLLLQGG